MDYGAMVLSEESGASIEDLEVCGNVQAVDAEILNVSSLFQVSMIKLNIEKTAIYKIFYWSKNK